MGNPRYAASKHSSFAGGLLTGLHAKNGEHKKPEQEHVDNKTYLDAGKTANFESIRLSNVNDAEQLHDFLDDEINEREKAGVNNS